MEGAHGFANVVCEFASWVKAPLESSRKNVTAPVAFPFAIVSTKSHGCGVCAAARESPERKESTARKHNANKRRWDAPQEGHGHIANFLVLNAGFSL